MSPVTCCWTASAPSPGLGGTRAGSGTDATDMGNHAEGPDPGGTCADTAVYMLSWAMGNGFLHIITGVEEMRKSLLVPTTCKAPPHFLCHPMQDVAQNALLEDISAPASPRDPALVFAIDCMDVRKDVEVVISCQHSDLNCQ